MPLAEAGIATQFEASYDLIMKRGRQAALRSADINFFDVVHAGERLRIQIKRVATARRFTLRVRAATRDAILTMPPRGSLTRAKIFVERHAAWVGARLARLPAPTPFGPAARIPLRGVMHEIVHRPDCRGHVWIEPAVAHHDSLPKLCVSGEAPFVARRMKDFLTRQARADLESAVRRHASALAVKPSRITLRDTITRWGSCSSSGALSFSWRLVMAPPYILDYLAAHEVAHLQRMDHSDAFWSLVERLTPDYHKAESWLKVHGTGLMRFGVTLEDAAQ